MNQMSLMFWCVIALVALVVGMFGATVAFEAVMQYRRVILPPSARTWAKWITGLKWVVVYPLLIVAIYFAELKGDRPSTVVLGQPSDGETWIPSSARRQP